MKKSFADDIKLDDISNIQKDYSGVYLFISIDMINGTEFKLRHTDWAKIFLSFYETTLSKFNDIFGKSYMLWKVIGDEILFYKKIDSKDDIVKFLPNLTKVINNISEDINKEHDLNNNLRHNTISLKTATWIANIKDYDTEHGNNIINIIFKIPTNKQNESVKIDFLGPEIDIGFRLSKYAHKNVIIVGAKLTSYLIQLKEKEDTELIECDIYDKLRIVDYKSLKGIWRERIYPIIWYSATKFNDIFDYDENVTISNDMKNNI